MSTHTTTVGTLAANGVDFIDEHDAGGLFLGLFKQVTDLCGTTANKHFHKLRTGHREERYVSLASNSLGQHGFTCTGRAYKQKALWHGCTDFRIFLGIVKVVYDFLKVLFCFINALNIIERGASIGFYINLSITFCGVKHH